MVAPPSPNSGSSHQHTYSLYVYVMMRAQTIERRATALGQMREVDLGSSRVRYWERGEGPPVVSCTACSSTPTCGARSSRPLPTPGSVPRAGLAARRHDIPMRRRPTSARPGMADLIAGFLEASICDDVTLVANDTGGALTQIMMARHPERIGRVVLTPSDCFEDVLPADVRAAAATGSGARFDPAARARCCGSRRCTGCRSCSAWVAKRPVPPEVRRSYLRPLGRAAGPPRPGAVPARRASPAHPRGGGALRDSPAGAVVLGQRGPGVPARPGTPARRAAARRPPGRGRRHVHVRLRGPARRRGGAVVEFAGVMAD